MNFFNRKGNSIIIVVIIAAVVALGVFAYLQFNTKTAYVVNGTIPQGTRITQDYLSNGTISLTEVPNSLVNHYLVTDFSEINGMYVKDTLKPGKIIFTYDIASSGDLRNNEILTTYSLEAVSIKANQLQGLTSDVNKGDKMNVYGTYTYDFGALQEYLGTVGVPVKDLLPEIKEVFLANGYTEEDTVMADEVVISKLLLQNVPVVEVVKNDYNEIVEVTIGVEPEHAEAIYLTMETGKLGFTVLPYTDGDYVEKETKGSISMTELKNKDTINDVNMGMDE